LFGDKPSIEDIADLLEKNAKFIRQYPSCTYLVRPTLEKLKEATKHIDQDEARIAIIQFMDFIENYVWNSGSSTISRVLDLKIQRAFVNYIAKYMSEMAKVLRENEFKNYLVLEDYWKKDFSPFLEQVRIASARQARSRRGAILKLVPKLQPWERKFVELLNRYGLLMQAEKPIFLLKSGYRSMYFFNPSHLISKSNVKIQENQKVMREFKEVLKMFIQHLKTELGIENIAALLTQKIGGEDPGTIMFAPLFIELGISTVYLDPSLDMIKGPIIEGDTLLIPFDGVTTTGRTVDKIIDRYERIVGEKPRVYALLWNRSSYLKRKNVPIWSIGPPLIILPEILILSIASYDDDLGYMWPSLNIFYDYLRDIYTYAEQDLTKYQKTRGEFEKLIIDFYKIKEIHTEHENERTAQLLGYFDTKQSLSNMVTYFINLLILCWNAIWDVAFGNKISRIEDPVGYVESVLKVEQVAGTTLILCSKLLKEKLASPRSSFPKFLERNYPWMKIHGIFVEDTEHIVKHIKDKYFKDSFLLMREITENEAWRDIEDRISRVREIYKKYVDQGLVDSQELERLLESSRKELYKLMKLQYKIVKR
jgi:hypothetical protein